MAVDHPTRYGFFATLPMQDTELAIKEAVYALDTLRADGVTLLASAGDHFLGDPEFDSLMCELIQRKAVVFIHPNVHPSSTELRLNIPGFYIEFACVQPALLPISSLQEPWSAIRISAGSYPTRAAQFLISPGGFRLPTWTP